MDTGDLDRLRDLSRGLHSLLLSLSRKITPGMDYITISSMALNLLERFCPGASLFSFDLNPNAVVCHNSLPATSLVEGDIFSLDIVLEKDGLFSDQAWTSVCGESSEERKALLSMAWDVSRTAVLAVRPGGDSLALKKGIYNLLRQTGYAVLEEACGHGIGRKVHMEPDINFSILNKDDVLWSPGMVFTIEPVLASGVTEMVLNREKIWVTGNNSDTAYFEHMVSVGERGVECLNLPEINLMSSIDIFQ